MKKSELRTGMLVQTVNSRYYKVMLNTVNGNDLLLAESGHYKNLNEFTEKLLHDNKDLNIKKVYKPHGINVLNSYDCEKDYSLVHSSNNVKKLSKLNYNLDEIQNAVNILSDIIDSLNDD